VLSRIVNGISTLSVRRRRSLLGALRLEAEDQCRTAVRGYALAKIGGKDVAGIGPKMSAEAPTMWLVYIATSDAADTVKKAKAAGGNVLGEPMQVGPQGTMAIIQDPSGAVIGVWQPNQMHGSPILGKANAFGWSELNSRGVDKAKPFY
jgi:predicted enzyme related to lactoylglutathione lyase